MSKGKRFLIALMFTVAAGFLYAGSVTIAGKAMASSSVVQNLAEQTNKEGGVRVKVTPRRISAEASTWDFEIVLDTHTSDLSQDLARSSVLIDTQGKPHAPIGWEGDPPGGHHRKGILRFKPLTGSTQTLELRITGVGGVDVRVFRWQLQ
jgi:hypothetical protein